MTSRKTALAVALSALVLILAVDQPAIATGRADRYHSGRIYRGSFPDPDVFRTRHRWVASGTTIAHRSLPMLTSTDGRVWRARRAQGTGRRRTNDALIGMPGWAARHRAGRRHYLPTWAPAIGRAASGRWLAAYAVPLRRHPGRRCIGIASSAHAIGPFRNHRRRPLVCPADQGAIDPDIFTDRGRTYLLWKTEGIWGRASTTIRVRRLDRTGRGFRRGSRAHTLLRTARPWEGPVIENPSMIRHRGRLYVFYSANRWYNRHYAIGYAVCRTVHGPCRRTQALPLLASGHGVSGPGGESAFHGPRGQLLLAYAAWSTGHPGRGRRLHVATLRPRPHGRLRVVHRQRRR